MQDKNPYAAPSARVADVNPSGEIVLAERGSRLAAVIVDTLCFIAVVVIMAFGMPGAFGPGAVESGATPNPVLSIVGVVGILALMVVNLVLLAKNGQTIGKKLLGVKIVRQDGSKAGLGRIFWLRIVANGVLGAIPFIGPLYSLVDVLFIFGERRRCIHDHIADTIVVKA